MRGSEDRELPMSSKQAAAGSLKDPVVLGDSGDDENTPTSAAAPGPGKRSLSDASAANAKHAKMTPVAPGSQTDERGAHDGDDASSSSSSSKYIQPVAPVVPDALAGSLTGKTDKYVIYMAIEEDKSSKFYMGIEKCAKNCLQDIHEKCMQMDGTRHVTLWSGKMTDFKASRIQFLEVPHLPIEIQFKGWINSSSGNYLKLAPNTTAKLKNMMGQLEGLPEGAKPKCDHLSLYRKRRMEGGVTAEFARVRKALENHDWGSVQGVSVRIKVCGTDYSECLVLAGV
jgi:hypothetical protein